MALVTAAEIKAFEGITGSSHDSLFSSLADRVTAYFGSWCNRIFESATYTDAEYDGTGLDTFIVKNPPVTAVTSIKVATDRDFAAATALDSARYVFDDAGVISLVPTGSVTSIVLGGVPGVWPAGKRNIQITYTGGFTVIPDDLKEAAILMISAWMNRRRRAGILSTTIGSETVTFQQKDIPDEVRSILSRYKLYPVLCGRSGD